MNRTEPILDKACLPLCLLNESSMTRPVGSLRPAGRDSQEFYHVYNRGNRKQPIFGEKSDYVSFLKKLGERSQKYAVRVVPKGWLAIVYCLMPNHNGGS